MRVILVFPCLHYVPLWFPEAPDQVIIFIVHYRNFPQLRMECKKIHQFFNREPYQIVYDLRLFWNWHLKTITLMFSLILSLLRNRKAASRRSRSSLVHQLDLVVLLNISNFTEYLFPTRPCCAVPMIHLDKIRPTCNESVETKTWTLTKPENSICFLLSAKMNNYCFFISILVLTSIWSSFFLDQIT